MTSVPGAPPVVPRPPEWLPQPLRDLWRRYRGPIADLLYVGAALLWTLTMALGTLAVPALVSLPVVAALLLRRRYPLAVALVGLVASATFFAAPVAALTITSMAVRRRGRALVLVCLAHWVVLVLSIAVATPYSTPLALALLSAVGVGGSAALGAFVGARRDLVESLRVRAERAEAEQQLRADQARLGERSRIAQEMHDVLAHKISLIALQAGGLEVRPDAGPEEVERLAGLIRGTAREGLEELRGVLGVLRGGEGQAGTTAEASLRPQPTLADVPELVDASADAGVPVRLHWSVPAGVPVPDVAGRTAHRVTQEALTNVHKHGHGAAAVVTVVAVPDSHVEVVVENLRPAGEVPSGPPLPGSGSGLAGLAERVQLAGGRFAAGATPTGFRVQAWIPWRAQLSPRPLEIRGGAAT